MKPNAWSFGRRAAAELRSRGAGIGRTAVAARENALANEACEWISWRAGLWPWSGAMLLLLLAVAAADGFVPHLFPANVQYLVRVDFAEFRKDPALGKFVGDAVGGIAGKDSPMHGVAETLDFKAENLGVLAGGIATLKGDETEFVMTLGGKFAPAAATKLAAMGKAGELTAWEHQGQPYYFDHRQREGAAFALLEGDTLVFAEKPGQLKAAIQHLADAQPMPAAMAEAWEWRREPGEAIRYVMELNDAARASFALDGEWKKIVETLRRCTVVARLGERPRLQARFAMADAAAAAKAKATVDAFLAVAKLGMMANSDDNPALTEALQALSLKTDNADVLLDISVSRATFDKSMKFEAKVTEQDDGGKTKTQTSINIGVKNPNAKDPVSPKKP
jgi:hypothetical protein